MNLKKYKALIKTLPPSIAKKLRGKNDLVCLAAWNIQILRKELKMANFLIGLQKEELEKLRNDNLKLATASMPTTPTRGRPPKHRATTCCNLCKEEEQRSLLLTK